MLRRSTATALAAIASVFSLAGPAFAEKVMWKYDDLPGDANELVNYTKTHPNYVHPGFVSGEAWGQVYRPKQQDYPVKILTVELVMAQSTKVAVPKKADYLLEFYNSAGEGPDPGSKPIWTINTVDFAIGGQIGVPVVGNTIMIYQFDWTKPENHPPLIQSGNIWVMVRTLANAKSLVDEWSEQCLKAEIAGLELGCGCQDLAAITDTATTLKSNVMHLVWPLGVCSGAKQWKFVENLTNEVGFTMKGDFLLRLGVDGQAVGAPDPDAGPTADGGSKVDAGSTDSGGLDNDVKVADSGLPAADVPPAKPVVELVVPNSAPNDKAATIEIKGSGFVSGCKVQLDATAVQVEAVAPNGTSLTVQVPPGLAVKKYQVVVTNPSGAFGFKEDAFSVTAPAAPDVIAAGPDAGAADTATGVEVGAETAGAPLVLDDVQPKCADVNRDTQVTVYGAGFRAGMKLRVGTTDLPGVDVSVSGAKATALLPKGFAPGEHSVMVIGPDGVQKVLVNAIRVGSCGVAVAATSAPDSCGAARTGHGGRGGAVFGTLLLIAAVLFVRRRVA
ncbi:MAG: hypothetical protein EXR79_10345 [Myxococcales bacterium]|nr:hypothetical protein [Myxococcales bacterium]